MAICYKTCKNNKIALKLSELSLSIWQYMGIAPKELPILKGQKQIKQIFLLLEQSYIARIF